MIILSEGKNGQTGLVDIVDLKTGNEYTILDLLHTEKGFQKITEFRIKHWLTLLIADKWGARPRTFETVSELFMENDEEAIGQVILTRGQHIVLLSRETDSKQDPYITIMEITDLQEEIKVKVIERFRLGEYARVINDHFCSYVIRLGKELLDVDVVDPNHRSLHRTLVNSGI